MAALLTSLPYFHGTIDTRECREMLPDLGDFLIRNPCKEMGNGGSTFVCILTTAVSPDQASENSKMLPKDYSLRLECTTRLKSYGITVDGGGLFSVQGSTETFPSVEALCNSYLQSRQPFPMGGMALRPVARRPWRAPLLYSDVEFPVPEVVLGSGEYGKVVKGKLLRHGIPPTDVALKCSTGEYADAITEIFTEARTMRALQHPNIIGLQGVVIEKPPLYLVIEFLDGSSLLDALQKKRVSNVNRFPICVAVLYGVLWMHTHNYIHRDIAARNVMVSHDCRTVKLIDFGLAKHGLQFTLNTVSKIPVKRLPPEVVRTRIFSAKSDTWALAICFWEVFHDGAEIYSNVIPSTHSKPSAPVTPVTTPVTSKDSKDKKNATQTRKRATKKQSETPKATGKEPGDSPELVITMNEDFLPKEFVPKFKLMTEKKARKRIELAAMAQFVEKEIFPTLPQMVQAELKIHMDRRPPFDPNFKAEYVNNNSIATQPTAATLPGNAAPSGAVTPTSTPATGTTPAKLKTVTRRRKPSAKAKSDQAQSSGSAPEKKSDNKVKTSRRKAK